MVGIELVAQTLKHGREGVSNCWLRCRFGAVAMSLGISLSVALKSRHFDLAYFLGVDLLRCGLRVVPWMTV
jgi:hypothetical protein